MWDSKLDQQLRGILVKKDPQKNDQLHKTRMNASRRTMEAEQEMEKWSNKKYKYKAGLANAYSLKIDTYFGIALKSKLEQQVDLTNPQ